MPLRRMAAPIKPSFRPPPGLPVVVQVGRNEQRRQIYHSDVNVREALKQRARQRYRKEQNLELATCLRSLAFYQSLSLPARVLLPSGIIRTMPVMGLQAVADCLGKIYQTVWRWKEKGMIPEPILEYEGKTSAVYHQEEVRVLIEEVGNHELLMAYYRSSHSEVKGRIFQRITALRETWEK